MSKHRITAVHMAESVDGTHEHIASVKVGKDGKQLSVEIVAADIRAKGGDSYFTKVDGVKAKVDAVQCPRCNSRDYLRTDPDKSKKDNLLSLPRF